MKKLLTVGVMAMLGFTLSAQKKELSYTPKLLVIDNNEACAIGDVNNDGLDDIVAGRYWYPAPDFVPHPLRPIVVHPPDYAQNNGEHLWDVDADGWLDVIASGWGESKIKWFKNPGKEGLEKGLNWESHTLADTRLFTSEAGFFEDIDGDGTPEYILNSYQHENPFMVWYFTSPVDKSPFMAGTIIGPKNGHGVGFGDINGDNRTDILIDDGWYEQPATNLWSGNWILHKDWVFDDGTCPYQVTDLNGDGKADVIYGHGHNFGLYWLEQTSGNDGKIEWKKHTIDESWSQVHTMLWTDIDGDGQEELITGKRILAHSGKDPGSSDPARLYCYKWNSKKKKFEGTAITEGNVSTGLFIRVADLNQDGKKDIVVAGKKGTYILWQD